MQRPISNATGFVQPSLGRGKTAETSLAIAKNILPPVVLKPVVKQRLCLRRERHVMCPAVLGSRSGQGEHAALNFSPPQARNLIAALAGQHQQPDDSAKVP